MNDFELDDLRARCELAGIRGESVSLAPGDVLELLTGHSNFIQLENEGGNTYAHHQDDCDRCDEIKEEIFDLKENGIELAKRVEELEQELAQKDVAIDRLIKSP